MARQKKATKKRDSSGANLGFEEKLWQAADKMRGHMDPAEYKHVVLGLIFLKLHRHTMHGVEKRTLENIKIFLVSAKV